jgi:ankyrin repeat protein
MLAAYHGHAPLVKLLIHHGADPNCLNDRGQSPLAGAVFKGEAEVIEVRLRSLNRKAGMKDADIGRLY